MPSANAHVSAPAGSRSVDGVQLSALAVVHTGAVTLVKPNDAGFATISRSSCERVDLDHLQRRSRASAALSVRVEEVR